MDNKTTNDTPEAQTPDLAELGGLPVRILWADQLQCENMSLRNENAALRDAINALRDFVAGKRHDNRSISEILNGAMGIPNEPVELPPNSGSKSENGVVGG